MTPKGTFREELREQFIDIINEAVNCGDPRRRDECGPIADNLIEAVDLTYHSQAGVIHVNVDLDGEKIARLVQEFNKPYNSKWLYCDPCAATNEPQTHQYEGT